MKRYIILSLILSFIFFSSDLYAQFILKTGMDFNGSHKSIQTFREGTPSLKSETNVGTSAGVEFIVPFAKNKLFLAGIGTEFQFSRSAKEIDGAFRFISIYPHMRARLSSRNSPHILLRFGVNLFSGDSQYDSSEWTGDDYYGVGQGLQFKLKGFLHYGVGAGIFINEKYLIEMIYNMNMGERIYRERVYLPVLGRWDLRERIVDIRYSSLNLTIGYRFGNRN